MPVYILSKGRAAVPDRRERVVLAPSLLSADLAELGMAMDAAERGGANAFHVDVMDGHFVPNITFGPSWLEAIRRRTRLPLDVHLMISEPMRYLERFAQAGGDTLVFHAEATDEPARVARRARALGVGAGVAIRPDTPFERVAPLLSEIDELIVMSVHPGFSGQKFIPESVAKIEAARSAIDRAGLDVELAVDGGINPTTAVGSVAAGATFLVCGNSVYAQGTVAGNLEELRAAVDRGRTERHEVR